MTDEAKGCNSLLPSPCFCKDVTCHGSLLTFCYAGIYKYKTLSHKLLASKANTSHNKHACPKASYQPCQEAEEQPNVCYKRVNVVIYRALILTFSPEIHLYIFQKHLTQTHSDSQSTNSIRGSVCRRKYIETSELCISIG